MDRKEVELLIDSKIRAHELRVAIVSGIVGSILVAGMFHAIHLAYVGTVH